MDIAKELLRLIKIDSRSGNEAKIIKYLEERLLNLGFSCVKQEVIDKRENLIINPLKTPKLVISTHVDTVSLENNENNSPRIENSKVYGIGSSDPKASIVSILYALEKVEKHVFEEKGITIAFFVDEEEQGLGSEKFCEVYKPEYALVLEPTDLNICIAEAGSYEVEIIVKGRAAHGSEVEKGENAIIKAFNLIKEVDKLSFLKEKHELIGKSNFNIQMIKGGGKLLAVPDICKLIIDFRLLPNQNLKNVKSEIEAFLRSKKAEFKFIDFSPPFEISPDSEIVKRLKEAFEIVTRKKAKIAGMKSWTDAENFYRAKAEAAIFGPGKLEVCHTKEEHVEIKDVEIAGEFLKEVVMGF